MAQDLVKRVWLVAVLAALPFPCSAQTKPKFVPVVPDANWRQVDAQPLPLSAIGKYGGDAAIEREYGVKQIELRTYELGKTRVPVLVEPAADVTSAYGLLTFYQTPAMTAPKDMALTVGDASGSLMARGNNFIRFPRAPDAKLSASDYQALLVFVGGRKPSASAANKLPHPMPAQGLLPGSEKYVVGLEAARRVLPGFRTDLVGFDQSAEVQLGKYQTDQGTSTLISIAYPTPQIARVRLGSLTNFLGVNQDRGADSIYGKRQGVYVFLVLNAGDQRTASSLLDRMQISENISWDQRYQTEKSFTLQVVHMILAIFALTAILISACVVVGVLFFASRRLAARFFPDSQWGRTDEDQLIRLNLKID
jgi:hypothetical protein